MELSRKALKIIAVVTSVSLSLMFYRIFPQISRLISMYIGNHQQEEAGSLGIMGSVDGPIAIFTTTQYIPLLTWLYFLISLAEIALHFFLLEKSIKALRKGK